MRRFWTAVAVAPEAGGHAVRLDDRPVRTPGRRPLLLPTDALAEAVAAEWRGVGETLDPRALPLTGLANAAVDLATPDPAGFAAPVAAYADSDLLLYRADAPGSLVAAQAAAWDPLLGWAAARYDVAFVPVAGIVHRPQPPATVARLGAALAGHDGFALAALSVLVTLGGSLVAALGVAEGAVDAAAAWDAVTVDERWQESRWGEDAEAAATRAAKRAEFDAAARFLSLLRA